MKKFFKIFLSFVFIFSLILNSSVFAMEDDFDDLFGDSPTVQWEVSDFIVEGDTVYGFSKSGVEKLKSSGDVILPTESADGVKITKVGSFAFLNNKSIEIPNYIQREGENGEKTDRDVDGNVIKNLGEDFNPSYIKSITIPDGYTYIGSDSFSFNKSLTTVSIADTVEYISEYAFAHCAIKALDLPASLKKLGDQAFFDNSISGSLIIPENFEIFGERSFKSNKISTIIFNGDKVKTIPEETFQDNQLRRITIPTSIKSISPTAFAGNLGDENYGNVIVLVTKDGSNPHNLPDNSVYINPSDDKRTTPLYIDYTNWNEKDFNADGNVVTGFSQIGKIKVRRNKNLVIPSSINGVEITEIGKEAFRNVDFNDKELKKYDLESVEIPDSVTKIGDWAFQSNNLTEFVAGPNLIEIGAGAFMNNKIEILDLNFIGKLEIIGDAAFHINEINAIVIPATVKKIGFSAFRENGASNVLFMGDGLEEIGEMAFLNNAITELDLTELTNLKKIDVQTFGANPISTLVLPEYIEEIAEEAFVSNKLTNVLLPKSLKRIAFNAFDNNENRTVELEVLDGVNVNSIPDGSSFIVNKNEIVPSNDTREDIRKIVEEIENLDLATLRDETREHFESMKNDGKVLLEKENLRLGEKLKYIHDSKFFIKRAKLDSLIKNSKEALKNPVNNKDVELLKNKLEYAERSYNNSALSQKQIARLEKELKLLTDLVNNQGEISKATMIQGHFLLESPLPIPEYHIGMNVYFDKDGKILYVLDMSYTIGKGQFDDYGNEIENVDEDNEGYHVLALATLDDYEGLNYLDILNNDVNSISKISTIEKAMYHREGIYNAIKDASNDYKKLVDSKNKEIDTEKIEKLNNNPIIIDKNLKNLLNNSKNNDTNKNNSVVEIVSKDKTDDKKQNNNNNIINNVKNNSENSIKQKLPQTAVNFKNTIFLMLVSITSILFLVIKKNKGRA